MRRTVDGTDVYGRCARLHLIQYRCGTNRYLNVKWTRQSVKPFTGVNGNCVRLRQKTLESGTYR